MAGKDGILGGWREVGNHGDTEWQNHFVGKMGFWNNWMIAPVERLNRTQNWTIH